MARLQGAARNFVRTLSGVAVQKGCIARTESQGKQQQAPSTARAMQVTGGECMQHLGSMVWVQVSNNAVAMIVTTKRSAMPAEQGAGC
jgi:hypothetical protein